MLGNSTTTQITLAPPVQKSDTAQRLEHARNRVRFGSSRDTCNFRGSGANGEEYR